MALKRFDVPEPGGAIRLLRITVPHRMRTTLTGQIPGLAGVSISTSGSPMASKTCQRHGPVEECTQSEEACPMPAAIWHFVLRKLAGPAGKVRLDFVVG
jgi:hypothetical protein